MHQLHNFCQVLDSCRDYYILSLPRENLEHRSFAVDQKIVKEIANQISDVTYGV